MDKDTKTFWEIVLAPMSASVGAAVILGLGSWMVWVSGSVAQFEDHADQFDSISSDIQEIKEGVGYLRGRIDEMSDRE